MGSKLYWYGSGGEILSETDSSGNTQNDYVFFGSKRVAMVPSSGSALYYAEDSLGSSRVIVQATGTLCYDADFTPFGGERAYTNTCAQNYKFEGKERDTETQNDDFGARYYSWRLGRWLSSDWSAVPVAVPYANLNNPQTLNLYAMASDDPETFADLDGHWITPGYAQWLTDFGQGLENAWTSDNLAGIGRQDQSTTAGQAGAVVGDAIATLQGVQEASAGGTLAAGGATACATGVGCAAGAPAMAVGAVAAVHGATTAAEGGEHLFSTAVKMLEGSSGQKPAGETKSTTPTGKTSSGQNINSHGEKLGPSRRPVRHSSQFSTVKRAKDAARQAGQGAPVRDNGHFHATDRNGVKLPNAGHFEFPE